MVKCCNVCKKTLQEKLKDLTKYFPLEDDKHVIFIKTLYMES